MISWDKLNNDKLVSTNTTIPYAIHRQRSIGYSYIFLARGGIDVVGTFNSQLEAIKACNEYEKQIKGI